MSPVQPMITCSCDSLNERIPLIIAECPCLPSIVHVGGVSAARTGATEGSGVGGAASSEGDGGMSASTMGGVAGGEMIADFADVCRVAVTGM